MRAVHRLAGAAVRLGALAALALGVAACTHDASWSSKNVTGLMPDLAFHLTDEHGRAVDASAYRGKVAVLYFGYTSCPDVCPTTLARLEAARRDLGDKADRVEILFVSVDPGRDRPAVLARYTDAFGKGIVGLTGTDPALRALTKRYRVTYSLGKPDASGNYAVTHSSAFFIFDAKGKVRLLGTQDEKAKAIASDLARLADEAA